jgi:hypothetical protein
MWTSNSPQQNCKFRLSKKMSISLHVCRTFRNTRTASPQPHAERWPGHYAKHRPVLLTYIWHMSHRRPVDGRSHASASSACKERWERKKRGNSPACLNQLVSVTSASCKVVYCADKVHILWLSLNSVYTCEIFTSVFSALTTVRMVASLPQASGSSEPKPLNK